MTTLQHKFVEYIPEQLEEGILYVTVEYRSVAHLCVCGCGNKVITPITPTDWQLTYDGKSITLRPSIGNWNFLCKSHYWITNNRIIHARKWSDLEIDHNREKDAKRKKSFFGKKRKNDF